MTYSYTVLRPAEIVSFRRCMRRVRDNHIDAALYRRISTKAVDPSVALYAEEGHRLAALTWRAHAARIIETARERSRGLYYRTDDEIPW